MLVAVGTTLCGVSNGRTKRDETTHCDGVDAGLDFGRGDGDWRANWADARDLLGDSRHSNYMPSVSHLFSLQIDYKHTTTESTAINDSRALALVEEGESSCGAGDPGRHRRGEVCGDGRCRTNSLLGHDARGSEREKQSGANHGCRSCVSG